MRSSLGFILAAVFSFAAICILPNTAAARVEAGLLTCEVGEGFALIVSKPRDLHCIFHKSNGQNEAYRGKLREIGIDIGVSGRGVIVWTVIAGTTELPPGELAGSYGGVEAGAAAVVGGRGAVLIGGAEKTISLQPLSVEVEAGLNIAVGITSMELHPLFKGRPAAHHERVPAFGLSRTVVPHARQEPHYGCGSYTYLQRGQTLSGLARTCGVTVEALLDANPQITNVRQIPTGELVHLPSHVGHHGSSPCGDRAILQKGESLGHVAWRCGVTLHTLLRANPDVREFSVLEAGLVLAIPARSEPMNQAPIEWAKTESDLIEIRDERPPSGSSSDAARNDAKVPGTDFNATGNLSCARGSTQPMTTCKFGVIRKGNGNGSITVLWPDGGSRVIFFEDNTPAYYDESEADGGAIMTVDRGDADLFTVKIGQQRFEFPEAVMAGG